MASTDARETTATGSAGHGVNDVNGVNGPTRARIGVKTLRTDRWWLYPATTFVVFSAFVVYATFRAFQGAYYYSSPYLSP